MNLESEKKHRLKVNLYPNLLTDDPNDYSARIISERTLSVRDVCVSAVRRGGAPSTIDAIEHNVNLFLKEMAYQMSDGFSVNTLYFVANAVVKGTFKSPMDTFDSKRHSIGFNFSQGETLRKMRSEVEVQVMGLANTHPYIGTVFDVKSGTVNDRLTPGRSLKIGGSKLKLAGDHADIGVYFIAVDSGIRTRVLDDEIVVNNPGELIVTIPELDPGIYQLEVATQYNNSNLLKKPRAATFENELTVD